jgi:Retroviral aspartyl protease
MIRRLSASSRGSTPGDGTGKPTDYDAPLGHPAGGKRVGRRVETRDLPPVTSPRANQNPSRNSSPHRVNVNLIQSGSVFPLKARNYKVSATVGVTRGLSTPVLAILDTGAGPNLIREETLPEDWERYRVTGEPVYNVVGAGGRRLRQKGVITIFVQLGKLRVKARFLVVTGLAADCILGCQFIDRHVRAILPKEKKVVLPDESAISILRDSDSLEVSPPTGQAKAQKPSTKLRVAKFVTVPPRSESLVWVQCAAAGLRFLQSQSRPSSQEYTWLTALPIFCPCSRFPFGC